MPGGLLKLGRYPEPNTVLEKLCRTRRLYGYSELQYLSILLLQ
jgi:hypothetical protein